MKAQKSTKISFPDVVVQLHLRTKITIHNDVTESDGRRRKYASGPGNKSRERVCCIKSSLADLSRVVVCSRRGYINLSSFEIYHYDAPFIPLSCQISSRRDRILYRALRLRRALSQIPIRRVQVWTPRLCTVMTGQPLSISLYSKKRGKTVREGGETRSESC